jgi:hypothetical protein
VVAGGQQLSIRILQPDKVKVLIRSKEIQERHGESPVFISFEYGEGVVYHMISHFYLQRAETRTLRQAAPSMSYVAAKGIGGQALRKYEDLGAEELTTGQLESAFTIHRHALGRRAAEEGRDAIASRSRAMASGKDRDRREAAHQ